ncbi:MAG: M28 family peptidase [Gemmatimonadales bacterium]|nr:M28 family peptidase [Gemmatimonadales bacterium]
MMARLLPLFALLIGQTLHAQAPGPLDGAAETITATDLQSRIEILAHDSMLGRDTPSPGLERAAAYVAGEFRRLGLRPAGEAGTYLQRFGVSRWTVDTGASSLELSARGARGRAKFGDDVRLISGQVSGKPIGGSAVLVAGPLSPAVTARPELRGRIVLLVPDFEQPLPFDLGERVEEIAAVARAVILVSNRDSSTFARRIESSLEPRLTPDFRDREDRAPVVELREGALGQVASATALDLPRLRAMDTLSVREMAGLRVDLRLVRHYLERAAVPNLAAVLEGGDRRRRGEYVVISAHLDHVGVRPGQADSVFNGADDNASGVAALLEMAEAFSRPEARPDRSLLFLVPSAEEKGLWGSDYYVRHPTVPLGDVVADLNMDLIGRNWPDSVIVTGPDMSTLGETLRRVGAAHPELRMAPLADRWPEERIFYRSDHYNFAVKGVPVLFFTSGTHTDYHQPGDAADRIDAEKASRLARLVFHVSAAVANAPERPRWNPGSYRRLVEER